MKKSLSYGLIFALVAIVIGVIMGNLDFIFMVTGLSGLGPLFFAGLLSGAFVSGDRNRANYHTENKDSRESRHQLMMNSLWFSAPNLLTAIITLAIFISNT
ncbi:DUF5316 domain-containing protein [Piscibacillus sp. B03]|uniref:DUF5316 domain-containing protein n=1 Tax=Piscibacillus sp. B03 TaxID=3457430 RepID=UPI003FCECBA9